MMGNVYNSGKYQFIVLKKGDFRILKVIRKKDNQFFGDGRGIFMKSYRMGALLESLGLPEDFIKKACFE